MKARPRSKSDMDLIDFAALGGGGIASGLITKTATKFLPTLPPQFLPAIPLIAGVMCQKAKDKTIHFVGYGLISRAIGDAANAFGIGEDMISESMELEEEIDEDIADEIAAEIAAEIEADNDDEFNS